MAIFVGARGSAGIGVDSGAAFPGAQAGGWLGTYNPGTPAGWSLLILVALIAVVVVIAHGAR
jgi:hypothetical protein